MGAISHVEHYKNNAKNHTVHKRITKTSLLLEVESEIRNLHAISAIKSVKV